MRRAYCGDGDGMDGAAFLELLHDTFGEERFTAAAIRSRLGDADIPIVAEAMGGDGIAHRQVCMIGKCLSSLMRADRVTPARRANRHGAYQLDLGGHIGQKRAFVVHKIADVDAVRRARVKVAPGVDLEAFAVDLDRRIDTLAAEVDDLRQLAAILQDRIRRSQPRPRR